MLTSRFGFHEADITLLRNAEASRDGDPGRLRRARRRRRRRTTWCVVHYSGHGSQMTDREGDEADGLDETIVPVGLRSRARRPNRDITDDEIYDWLTRLTAKTQLVTLVFDCCHSGTVTRDVVRGAHVRRIEPDLRPPEELPPSPVASRAATRGAGPSGWLPPGRRYTLIAGCRDEELSHEHDTPDGADARRADVVPHARAQRPRAPGATYRDVFEPAALGVTTAVPEPASADRGRDRPRGVRGRGARAGARSCRSGRARGDGVTLGGGAAQGVAGRVALGRVGDGDEAPVGIAARHRGAGDDGDGEVVEEIAAERSRRRRARRSRTGGTRRRRGCASPLAGRAGRAGRARSTRTSLELRRARTTGRRARAGPRAARRGRRRTTRCRSSGR